MSRRRRLTFTVVLGVVAIALLALLAASRRHDRSEINVTAAPPAAASRTEGVSGNIAWDGDLPPGAELEVAITKNGSKTDWQETIIDKVTPGIAFVVPFADAEIDPEAEYAIQAHAFANNVEIRSATDAPLVITNGRPIAAIQLRLDGAPSATD